MLTSQSPAQTSDSTLSKLIQVDSELATQETELAAQLEAIQEKRKSLQTVLGMFGSDTAPVVTPKQPVPANDGPASNAAPSNSAQPTPPEAPVATEEPKPKGRPGRKAGRPPGSTKSAAPRQSKRTAQLSQPVKGNRKPQKWQSYVRDEFKKTSMPDAVSDVLERHSDEMVEISMILDTLFVDDTPKEAREQARHRISNILFQGMRANKWHRGKAGRYSVSQDAAKSDLAS